MLYLKKIILGFLLIIFTISLSSCVMMPLMMGGMAGPAVYNKANDNIEKAVTEMVEENVGAMNGERGLNDRILIGEVKVDGNLFPAAKLHQLIQEALQDRNMDPVAEEEVNGKDSLDSSVGLTVLNTQIYQAEGRLWLAQQLADLRTNRIVWSGIQSRPLSNSKQNPQNEDASVVESLSILIC